MASHFLTFRLMDDVHLLTARNFRYELRNRIMWRDGITYRALNQSGLPETVVLQINASSYLP